MTVEGDNEIALVRHPANDRVLGGFSEPGRNPGWACPTDSELILRLTFGPVWPIMGLAFLCGLEKAPTLLVPIINPFTARVSRLRPPGIDTEGPLPLSFR